MEPEGSLSYLPVPATCPFPESDQSSLCPLLPLPEDLPSGSFPQISSPKPCIHLCCLPYVLHTPPIPFFSILSQTKEYRSLSSLLCSFLHSPVPSSLLGPNILLSTVFSNTLNLCSSLSVNDQVSHPYKTTAKF